MVFIATRAKRMGTPAGSPTMTTLSKRPPSTTCASGGRQQLICCIMRSSGRRRVPSALLVPDRILVILSQPCLTPSVLWDWRTSDRTSTMGWNRGLKRRWSSSMLLLAQPTCFQSALNVGRTSCNYFIGCFSQSMSMLHQEFGEFS